ncbi:MAG TPA: alpha/beta fold hydrolase [Vicinamibacterales bacterium]|nr:alpha/beta fold hydrolase [Vicinamibacterales bacterium]
MTLPRQIDGPAGPLEVLFNMPDGQPVRAAAVIGHPHPLHGGTMHTKVVFRTARALASIGCAVLRFNFRGVGRSAGAFAEGEGEREDFKAALDFMAARHPDVPLWAGGMSFGSYVALTAGAEDARVQRLLGIAPPVDRYDFSPLRRSRSAKFIIHGEHDEICPLASVAALYEELTEPKRLIVIPGANHLFTGCEAQVGEAVISLFED